MTFKDKPKQLFNSEELHRIAGAAQNLSNTCYFEIGLLGLANDRHISQEDGALIPYMKQLLMVLNIPFLKVQMLVLTLLKVYGMVLIL